MSWLELKVHVDLRREILWHAPEYDPTRSIEGDDEARVGRYYGRPKCRGFREDGTGATPIWRLSPSPPVQRSADRDWSDPV